MKTLVEMLFGSHMYGTATPESDRDYKGVFLPPVRDCFLNRVPKSINTTTGDQTSKNTKDDVDREFYSLQYFIKLALEGQTVAIDMLHAPDSCIIESSPAWRHLVTFRDKFYTKNLKAFVGYARKQAAKYGIKGSRLDNVQEVLDFLSQCAPGLKMLDVWDLLPDLEHTHFLPPVNSIMMYEVVGKSFQSTVKIGYVIPILEKHLESFGQRAILAKQNKGIDWKACSHAMRAALQVKELLTTHNIEFPLKDADLLTRIKAGDVDYTTEYAIELEKVMAECEVLSQESLLPAEADAEYWENFIIQVYMKEVQP